MSDANIENVSDTALWVATFRAEEGKRPDAAFQDPLSGILAGERGPRIARKMAFRSVMSWIMVMRTLSIDRLIAKALDAGVDTVLNLGAGLDTRPYRLNLPASLRWIEVDFPQIIAMKTDKLRAEKPRCNLERIVLDLTKGDERRAMLAEIGGTTKKLLVITEGVIPYLTNTDAATLSDDLAAVPSLWGWVQDYNNGASRQKRPKNWHRKLKAAPFQFQVEDWHTFFTSRGWKIQADFTAVEQSEQLKRPFPFVFPWSFLLALMPERRRRLFRKMSGSVLYSRR